MKARWNDEVARAFRRPLEKHRRLDLDELVCIHVSMHCLHDAVTRLQHPLHPRAAEVEVSILEPRRLISFHLILDFEGWGLRLRDDLQIVDDDLHIARRHLWILRSRRTPCHLAFDTNHVFVSHLGCHCGDRSDNDLDCAPAVAQIDERHAAVVASTRDPAVKLDLAADIGRANRAAVRCGVSDHASRSGSWSQVTSACSPLAMSRSRATRRGASSALTSTTHRAPSLSAER